ncbi:CHAT domain-containing protein [Frankia sp. Cr2]|uniref:CHAT domain-containing protein n=1 Tax=Frankia sp. Cr2 TaxID=3073932 RepID=UPI002AD27E0F|nr:CHAT domain-containing protein [Frankia sp. Cr2]
MVHFVPKRAHLRISGSEALYTSAAGSAISVNAGLAYQAVEEIWEVERRRKTFRPSYSAMLEFGSQLGNSMLGGAAAAALFADIENAELAGSRLRLGIEIDGSGLLDFPWEALVPPGMDSPLALLPNVEVYRRIGGRARMRAEPPTSGVLRVVVVIASPERGGGQLLDYEYELDRIIDALGSLPERGMIDLEILTWGSLNAIRNALAERPTHILHISCHAAPGTLFLETDAGDVDPIGLGPLVAAFPSHYVIPLTILAGCSTAIAGSQPGSDATASASELPSLARGLVRHSETSVIAMTAAVGDAYATELVSGIYQAVADSPSVDTLTAFTAARLGAMTDHAQADWSVPAFFCTDEPTVIEASTADAFTDRPRVRPANRPRSTFIGRRAELRALHGDISASGRPILLTGMAGSGKTALITKVLAGLTDENVVVLIRGATESTEVIAVVLNRVEEWCRARSRVDMAETIENLRDHGLPHSRQFTALNRILGDVRVLLVLDEFEENLRFCGSGFDIRDQNLQELIIEWMRLIPRTGLILVSRLAFTLAKAGGDEFLVRRLGPLSGSETQKMIWRHPNIMSTIDTHQSDVTSRVEARDRSRGRRIVLGHPGAIVHLEEDLAAAKQPIGEAVRRTLASLSARSGLDFLRQVLAVHPLGRKLLDGAVAYRRPVPLLALYWQVSAVPEARTLDPELLARLDAALTTGPGIAQAAIDIEAITQEISVARRPVLDPDFLAAVEFAIDLGLICQVETGGQEPEYVVHGWIREVLRVEMAGQDAVEHHIRAGRYWEWVYDDPAGYLNDPNGYVCLLDAYHHYSLADPVAAERLVPDLAFTLLGLNRTEEAEKLVRNRAGSWSAASQRIDADGILAHILVNRGAFGEAADVLSASLAGGGEDAPDAFQALSLNLLLSNALLGDARPDEAVIAVDTAGRWADNLGDLGAKAAIYRARAAVSVSTGDYVSARRDAGRAVAIWEDNLSRFRSEFLQAALRFDVQVLTGFRGAPGLKGVVIRHGRAAMLGFDAYIQAQIIIAALAATAGKWQVGVSALDQAMEQVLQMGPLLASIYEPGIHLQRAVLAFNCGTLDQADRNARRALETAESRGSWAEAANAALLLGQLAAVRGAYDVAIRWFGYIFAMRNPPPNIRTMALLALAGVGISVGDVAHTADLLKRANRNSQATDNPTFLIIDKMVRGMQACLEEDLDRFTRFTDEAKAIATDAGSSALFAFCMVLDIVALLEAGAPLPQTRDECDSLIAVAEQMDQLILLAMAKLLLAMAIVESNSPDLDEAESACREAQRLAEHAGMHSLVAQCADTLGEIATRGGLPASEVVVWRKLSVLVGRRVGDRSSELGDLVTPLSKAISRGDEAEADRIFAEMRLRSKANSREAAITGLIAAGRLAQRGNWPEANDRLLIAFRTARLAGDRQLAGYASIELGRIAYRMKDLEGAEKHFIAAVKDLGCSDLEEVARVLAFLSVVLCDRAVADPEWWKPLLHLSNRVDDPGIRAVCLEQAGRVALLLKDYARAEPWLAEAVDLGELNPALGSDLNGRRRLLANVLINLDGRTVDAATKYMMNVLDSVSDDTERDVHDVLGLLSLRLRVGDERFAAMTRQILGMLVDGEEVDRAAEFFESITR